MPRAQLFVEGAAAAIANHAARHFHVTAALLVPCGALGELLLTLAVQQLLEHRLVVLVKPGPWPASEAGARTDRADGAGMPGGEELDWLRERERERAHRTLKELLHTVEGAHRTQKELQPRAKQ